MWHWPSCRFQGSVTASREYNDIVSIHIMLIWQRPYYTVCGHMGHNVGRLPIISLHQLQPQFQGRVETNYTAEFAACVWETYSAGVSPLHCVVRWAMLLETGVLCFEQECTSRHSSSAYDDYYWRITVSGESWIVYYLGRSSACDTKLRWYYVEYTYEGNCNPQQRRYEILMRSGGSHYVFIWWRHATVTMGHMMMRSGNSYGSWCCCTQSWCTTVGHTRLAEDVRLWSLCDYSRGWQSHRSPLVSHIRSVNCAVGLYSRMW